MGIRVVQHPIKGHKDNDNDKDRDNDRDRDRDNKKFYKYKEIN